MHEQIRSFTTGAAGATVHERRVLNLGCLSDQERARALRAFEELSSGDSLEIVAHCQPGRLFIELHTHYGPAFYLWPLERGPLVWRVMLAKLASGVQLTVTGVMGADQHRLYKLWREFRSAVELGQIERAHRCSTELSLGLRRYIDIEETVLFPLFEAQTRMSGDKSTTAMRAEHREIERVVDQLDRLRSTADRVTMLQLFEQPVELMAFFQGHCRREAAVLYHLMEMVFNYAEERELVSLIQRFEI